MEEIDYFMDEEFEVMCDFYFDENIAKNHKTAEMLSKKGYKVKKPMWDGLMAS